MLIPLGATSLRLRPSLHRPSRLFCGRSPSFSSENLPIFVQNLGTSGQNPSVSSQIETPFQSPLISGQNLSIFSQSLTISDQELASRGFIVHHNAENLDPDDLNSVFVKVGFPRRQKEKIVKALDNTPSLIWIEDTRSKKLVAFARATGDDIFNAIIWDVVVDPSFQGFGLGKAVMERLLKGLLEKGIVNIALYAEPGVLGFYRPLGFAADPDGIRGMVYSRRKKKKQ
ncbi:hypothetical protein AMTRI_Chr08g164600 [Amborella trichopoda]|uniref:N-acetyltransferase domain-containing protein n=1 Tax=Amborella trichopoda TaxID=13333 RepID=W1P511_AMBTC|nr:serotonin N-acetyltransferase 2, chloroplastic [Amborella trichopoda]ERN04982.1 hypothetical protein AMTR_s00080p00183240 [Amborella trichopoda]|eukprot:XP_006843307.1 serotonin N-acetyltransferase 2, chloroplastic [Amborella trichopoda]